MTAYLLVLPISILVAYSQIIVKWRAGQIHFPAESTGIKQALTYLADPLIFSAYVAAFVASLGWLYVVTKLPLTVAFPVYIGATFTLVLIGGWFFLSEVITLGKLIAMLLILSGIALGLKAGE